MKNVIYSMLAKISKMDAEAKQLTAQVEAQALLLSAMLITIGKGGSFEEMVEAVKQSTQHWTRKIILSNPKRQFC